MLPNFGDLEYKLEQSLLLMEKIVFELREIRELLKENNALHSGVSEGVLRTSLPEAG